MATERVVKCFAQIAVSANCCIEFAQRTRKSSQSQQGELTADDSRGANAVANALRRVRLRNRMTAQEAETAKIAAEERRHYLRQLRKAQARRQRSDEKVRLALA